MGSCGGWACSYYDVEGAYNDNLTIVPEANVNCVGTGGYRWVIAQNGATIEGLVLPPRLEPSPLTHDDRPEHRDL